MARAKEITQFYLPPTRLSTNGKSYAHWQIQGGREGPWHPRHVGHAPLVTVQNPRVVLFSK